MKKIKRIGLILMGGIALAFIGLFVRLESTAQETRPLLFSTTTGKQWVEKCIEQHPEVLWMADGNVRKTEEGQAVSNRPYSEQLFGQKFIEFDRTIMTIRCMKLILDGSDKAYKAFTSGQPEHEKLSRESFQRLHRQGQQLLESKWQGLSKSQMAQAMETALVLGDMGKSEKAREIFKSYGINHIPDHDDFYGEAMQILEKEPHICPSFASLPSSAKALLLKVANLAHYGHITHLEGGVDMFRILKQSSLPHTDPAALSFNLFVHTCDVAGALGHVNNQASIAYTEHTHQAIQAMGNAVKTLSDPSKTEFDAYNAYLTIRANWLGLNSEDKLDRVLARIGAMLRLFTPEEGKVLKKAILGLEKSSLCKIVSHLVEDSPFRTPTYMPALLVNLTNNLALGISKEERLAKAITIGLPFIARALEKHQELITNGEADPHIPLNFNTMAGIAKTAPDLLLQEFYIDKEGNVGLLLDTKPINGVHALHDVRRGGLHDGRDDGGGPHGARHDGVHDDDVHRACRGDNPTTNYYAHSTTSQKIHRLQDRNSFHLNNSNNNCLFQDNSNKKPLPLHRSNNYQHQDLHSL